MKSRNDNHQYVIGIDAGTTNIKVVLYNMFGEQLFAESSHNRVHTYQGNYNEQDMNELWRNVIECIKRLLQRSEVDSKHIIGVGVSGQGEGLWSIDADGEPVRNAILWNDGRAESLLNDIKSDDILYKGIKKTVASYIRSGSTLTLIKWFYDNQKPLFEKTSYIFTCKDWLRYKLTGEVYWEVSDASCSCTDIQTLEYPVELFKTLGIESALEKLPKLIGATDHAGFITKEVAEMTGLQEGTPISGGMIDIVSTVVGTGAIDTNSICVILGTTGMNLVTLQTYESDNAYNGWERHMDKNKFVKGMGTMAATPNMDWFIQEIMGIREPDADFYKELEEKIGEMKPGEGGIIYLPHISPSGERAPFYNPCATAQFMGLKATTTKYEMIHSIMEGVALSIKDCLLTLDSDGDVYLTGGGAKNLIWAQIISDCLNRRVIISDSSELAAKGAAFSVVIMTEQFNDQTTAIRSFTHIKHEMFPNAENHKKYNEIYRIYKKVQRDAEFFWSWRSGFIKEDER